MGDQNPLFWCWKLGTDRWGKTRDADTESNDEPEESGHDLWSQWEGVTLSYIGVRDLDTVEWFTAK